MYIELLTLKLPFTNELNPTKSKWDKKKNKKQDD